MNPRVKSIQLVIFFLSFLLSNWAVANDVELEGVFVQGGLVFGQVPVGSSVRLGGQAVMVSDQGRFVLGFGRDHVEHAQLNVVLPSGLGVQQAISIKTREYNEQHIEGVAQKYVAPAAEVTQRIQADNARVRQARALRDQRNDFLASFEWPATGPISGVYGSRRVFNGVPKRPHYGVDVAVPTGSSVFAPAPGVVTLADEDQYYSGGTIILDHGHGLSSTFLHLSKLHVHVGQAIEQGELIAEVGATGRATGPHLDWRMNWLNQRVDPQLLVPTMGE